MGFFFSQFACVCLSGTPLTNSTRHHHTESQDDCISKVFPGIHSIKFPLPAPAPWLCRVPGADTGTTATETMMLQWGESAGKNQQNSTEV